METSVTRQLRHDLRTPVNHILGYAELALETAADDGGQEALDPLRRIVALGAGLTKLIDARLPRTMPDAEAPAALVALRDSLRPQLEQIHLISQFPALDQEAYREDMDRIRGAAAKLLGEQPASVPARRNSDAQASGKAPQRSCGHILAADDDEVNRDVLRRMLINEGYEVAVACSGDEAWNLLECGRYDLVLLDMIMPGLTGFEVLSRIKASRVLRETPVIVISGLDDIASIAGCIEAGAEDFLPKPFEPALLRARVGASLSKRRLRQQLAAQEKLASLGSLAAGIAHEIRNPLNFILNFADLSREMAGELTTAAAADSQMLIEDIRENLKKICEHAHRADQIVRAMLLHSRVGTEERQLVDPRTLASESLRLALAGSGLPSVTTETDFDSAALGPVMGCPQDLSRAFLNLAGNSIYAAAKTAPKHGRTPHVKVSAHRNGSFAEVAFRDNGEGVAESIRDKIFQPFFTTKPAGEGTGLGLSISFDIIAGGHGGELLLDSEPGQYAEFIVRLPLETAPPGTATGVRQ